MLRDWGAEGPDRLPSAAAVSSCHFAAQLTSSAEGEEKADEAAPQEAAHFNFLVFPGQDAAVDALLSITRQSSNGTEQPGVTVPGPEDSDMAPLLRS